MEVTVKYLILFAKILLSLQSVNSYSYSVKVGTENHINVVDTRFLSFTVDPKYLFSSSEKYNSKESVCMASALTPAYIRIAGPSTAHMTFHNATITFTDLADLSKEDIAMKAKESASLRKNFDFESDESKESFGFRKRLTLPTLNSESEEHDLRTKGPSVKNKRHSRLGVKKGRDIFGRKEKLQDLQELVITHSQWNQFVQWTKSAGFDLVFALNNDEKIPSGLWDPNSAINIMTLAEKANVSDIFWQLGYECSNQSIDDYLNDLETLRAIVESFSSAQDWRVVGGDITKCLQADSKSDFRDYVTLTDEMMDAVVLNGNSSAHELQRMSEHDRLKLLKLLSNSSTPLWLVDSPQTIPHTELHRAADWLTSLGYSAKNGFALHFRELIEEELFEPSLSFYMALIFKNLVGERVLDVDMDVSQAVLFAHCTSLRHKPVPGAVTLYGVNMDEETARFAVKLSRREGGGDIMQFIIGHDLNGNIIVNGRAIFDGDIRPVVKRVRPFKTLLLSLPPKSIGFWVIASTKIEACQETDDQDITQKEFVEAISVDDDEFTSPNTAKTKRSMIKVDNVNDVSKETLVKEALKERVQSLSASINTLNQFLEVKTVSDDETLSRRKRQLFNEDDFDILSRRKEIKYLKKKFAEEPKPRLDFIRKLIGMPPRKELARAARHNKIRQSIKGTKSRSNKRNPKYTKAHSDEDASEAIVTSDLNTKLNRRKRNVIDEKQNVSHKMNNDVTSENEIFDADNSKEMKLWRILHKIHKQIKDLSVEDEESNRNLDVKQNSENTESKDEEQFVVKTKMADDGATIKFRETTKHGLLKSTIDNVVSVLSDLNQNLNKFWNALTLLQ